MANARQRFDTIREYLIRHYEVAGGFAYGKPAASFKGEVFMLLVQDDIAFRLHGRSLQHNGQLPGSSPWDPLNRKPDPIKWLLVPRSQFLRWDRIALDSFRCIKEQSQGVVRPVAAPAPRVEPPKTSFSNLADRVAAFLKSGRLASMTLVPRDDEAA
jgi:hypothetical protein